MGSEIRTSNVELHCRHELENHKLKLPKRPTNPKPERTDSLMESFLKIQCLVCEQLMSNV